MLKTSNSPTINLEKVPTEALFINWDSVKQYVFKTADMKGLGAYTNGYYVPPEDSKGALNMSDCNLAHCMIAKGFDLNGSVQYLLDTFTL